MSVTGTTAAARDKRARTAEEIFGGKSASPSRAKILQAAADCFRNSGYAQVSVEEIAATAGVSRMTFYRQFKGKSELASELLSHGFKQQEPVLLSICEKDWRDYDSVRDWIRHLFEADRANRMLLRVFIQASAIDEDFTQQAHEQIALLIASLGNAIPAFALKSGAPLERRRWLEAWLLIYELLDQSNHAALDSGVASDPMMLDILTERFLGFVRIRENHY